MQDIFTLQSKQFLSGISSSLFNQSGPFLSPETEGVSATGFLGGTDKNGVLEAEPQKRELKLNGNSITDLQDACFAGPETNNLPNLNDNDVFVILRQNGDVLLTDLSNDPVSFEEYKFTSSDSPNKTDLDINPMPFDVTEQLLASGSDGYEVLLRDLSGLEADFSEISNSFSGPYYTFYDRAYSMSDGPDELSYDDANNSYVESLNLLDLPSAVVDMADDGRYLVFATEAGRIYYWNTYGISYQRAYDMPPRADVLGVAENEGNIYILTQNGIKVSRFDTPPSDVVSFDEGQSAKPADRPDGRADSDKHRYGIEEFRGGIIYVNDNQGITYVGPAQPGEDGISAHNLLSNLPSGDNEIVLAAHDSIIVNNRSGGVHEYNVGPGDPSSRTNQVAETRVIDMGTPYDVDHIDVTLSQTMSGNDKIEVSIRENPSESYQSLGTKSSSDTNHLRFRNDSGTSKKCATLQIKVDFLGGNPGIIRITPRGDQVNIN